MDDRLLVLAGVKKLTESDKVSDIKYLLEAVDVSDIADLDDAARRLVHCKRALSIANTLPDEADKKKWKSAAMVNLNKVRSALVKFEKQIQKEL